MTNVTNINLRSRSTPYIISILLAGFFVFPGASQAAPLQDWLYEDLHGFVEIRNGWRLDNDVDEKDVSIAEARLQLDLSKDIFDGSMKFKGDLVGDAVTEELRPELRELNYGFSPTDIMDLKLGRQILTWGTGDLLFINDLFPKDWESFFIGRDDEYLKAPSDAIKGSLFFDMFALDLVYVPVFNNSNFIDGSRISYWNPLLGRTAGRDFILEDHERNQVFRDSEFAGRLSKNIEGVELAFYGYYGFWKTPEGFEPTSGKVIYPRLSVFGASARGAIWNGIGNVEFGYYDSISDKKGTDPFIRNSEIRFLTGYERELAREFTGGLQYYSEYMQDYDAYESNLPPGMKKADKFRHVFTVRLTKLLMNQNLRLSLFGYFSPSDEDVYIRPKVHYKISDNLAAEAGGNIFWGTEDHTFFGQFEDNTNLYAGVRWSF